MLVQLFLEVVEIVESSPSTVNYSEIYYVFRDGHVEEHESLLTGPLSLQLTVIIRLEFSGIYTGISFEFDCG